MAKQQKFHSACKMVKIIYSYKILGHSNTRKTFGGSDFLFIFLNDQPHHAALFMMIIL